VEEMFRMGFVGEVRGLLDRYPKRCHAFKAIGYRQIIDHLDGRTSLEEAILLTQQASRRYAKRQLTWFRSDPEIVWIKAAGGPEPVASEAASLIGPFLMGVEFVVGFCRETRSQPAEPRRGGRKVAPGDSPG
ncbi:MAG: hypothetical protein FJW35_11910, partial [Acidobacteria bacterium]|nr:hypothetical protein [Acidobacteriota bacterium]